MDSYAYTTLKDFNSEMDTHLVEENKSYGTVQDTLVNREGLHVVVVQNCVLLFTVSLVS